MAFFNAFVFVLLCALCASAVVCFFGYGYATLLSENFNLLIQVNPFDPSDLCSIFAS